MLRFVSESEAIEASRLTGGFIADLTINTTVNATSFLAQMRLKDSDISFRSFESPNDLARGLRDDLIANDDFLVYEGEFVYICNSTLVSVAKEINKLKEFASIRRKKKGKNGRIKVNFVDWTQYSGIYALHLLMANSPDSKKMTAPITGHCKTPILKVA